MIARRLLTKSEQGASRAGCSVAALRCGLPSIFRFPGGTKEYDNY